MELKEFQLNAVKSLFEAMDKPVRDIILKSPTGSGKTIILTYFMHQYIQSYPKTVFVWLTPGKGNLEEQSKAKMDKYIHASQTKLLSDVMTAGFEENDSCFINWEKLTKKGDVDINPLIIVQIPNKSETLLDGVERWFEAQGLTYENGQLAVWLSDRHENLEGIDAPAAPSTAVIIKQAVATGWDCPRAQILVKLRDNMDETFEIQTIGRIRRMPEAKHYGSDLLDSCYLYTFDEKFTAGVKMALDKGALNACTLFLKSEYKDITLTGEQRSMISQPRNSQKALRAIWLYAEKSLGVGADKEENRIRLQAAGYILRDDVVRHTVSGETATLDFSSSDMNTISVTEKLNTHKHGRDYHQKIGKIGLEIGMEYPRTN